MFWPFFLLAGLIYFFHKKIPFRAFKYSLMALSILILIPVGFAWTYGFFSVNPSSIQSANDINSSGTVAGAKEENSNSTEPLNTSDKQEAQFVRVVDGDTIEVMLNGKKEKVRIIGIDTPEVVDPRTAPECLGRQASEKAGQIFANHTSLILEKDPSQQERDRYDRLLRFVFLNLLDFNPHTSGSAFNDFHRFLHVFRI